MKWSLIYVLVFLCLSSLWFHLSNVWDGVYTSSVNSEIEVKVKNQQEVSRRKGVRYVGSMIFFLVGRVQEMGWGVSGSCQELTDWVQMEEVMLCDPGSGHRGHSRLTSSSVFQQQRLPVWHSPSPSKPSVPSSSPCLHCLPPCLL